MTRDVRFSENILHGDGFNVLKGPCGSDFLHFKYLENTKTGFRGEDQDIQIKIHFWCEQCIDGDDPISEKADHVLLIGHHEGCEFIGWEI